MRVWVIPVQSRWLSGRDSETILKRRLGGLNRSVDRLVLMAGGWNLQPVKMQVCRDRCHGSGRTGVGSVVMLRPGSTGIGRCRQFVLQIDYDFIPRLHSKRGRFRAVLVDIAITGQTVIIRLDSGALRAMLQPSLRLIALPEAELPCRRWWAWDTQPRAQERGGQTNDNRITNRRGIHLSGLLPGTCG